MIGSAHCSAVATCIARNAPARRDRSSPRRRTYATSPASRSSTRLTLRPSRTGEIHAIMGPNGAGKSTLAYVLGGRPGYEVTEGSRDLHALRHPRPCAGVMPCRRREGLAPGVARDDDGGVRPARHRAARARRGGAVPGLPISGRNPRRLLPPVPPRKPQFAAQSARREGPDRRRVHPPVEGQGGAARHGCRDAQAPGQRRLFRRREEARRDGPAGHHGPADSRCSTRPTAASTSTR